MSKKQQRNSKYKNICIIFIINIFLIFSVLFFTLHKTSYVSYNKRDSYILKQLDENYLNSYLQNKNTLVIFFASWCDHCLEEKDTITEFSKNNPNIPIIIVSHDTSYEDIENYLKDNDLNWFVIFDTKKEIRNKIDENSSGIPCLYLIDKNSNVIEKLIRPFNYDDISNFYYK